MEYCKTLFLPSGGFHGGQKGGSLEGWKSGPKVHKIPHRIVSRMPFGSCEPICPIPPLRVSTDSRKPDPTKKPPKEDHLAQREPLKSTVQVDPRRARIEPL